MTRDEFYAGQSVKYYSVIIGLTLENLDIARGFTMLVLFFYARARVNTIRQEDFLAVRGHLAPTAYQTNHL